MLLLSLLEASQTAVESSDQALKAAEAALNAAQTANKQAKEVLRAVTEAFVQEDREQLVSTNNIKGHGRSKMSITSTSTSAMVDSDDFVDEFVMLSTNNNNNIEDVEDESHNFLLISSTGPAADIHGKRIGLYRKTDDTKEGRSVYVPEHDMKYGNVPYRLASDKGVWRLTWGTTALLRAATPGECPTSVKWQYAIWGNNGWRNDKKLMVTGLSEKPSDCEITISLRWDIERDITEPTLAGVYRAEGSYYLGRPVLQHRGGCFKLYVGGGVEGGCWKVSSDVGGDWHLLSGSAPGLCPADPRAERNEQWGITDWLYENLRGGVTYSRGISVKCNRHKH